MPEQTIICCGTVQTGNSKWAPAPRERGYRICGEASLTWLSVYGPALPPGWIHPDLRKQFFAPLLVQCADGKHLVKPSLLNYQPSNQPQLVQ